MKLQNTKRMPSLQFHGFNVARQPFMIAIALSVLAIFSASARAETEEKRPYAVFVNGFLDCCAWDTKAKATAQGMTLLQQRLESEMNAEIRQVPYSNFVDKSKHIGSSDSISKTKIELKDKKFIEQGAKFINTQLDQERPLILIGHSFGGDSIMRLLPQISRTRKILFVGVIDPVADFGSRSALRSYSIPRNVDYFYNRWQMNGFPPVDFQKSGRIFGCRAQVKCDQANLSLRDITEVARDPSPPNLETEKALKQNSQIFNRNFLCTQLDKRGIPKQLEFLCPNGSQTRVLPANAIGHSQLPVLPEVQREIGDILAGLLTPPSTE